MIWVQVNEGVSTFLECLVVKCLFQLHYNVAAPANMRWNEIELYNSIKF